LILSATAYIGYRNLRVGEENLKVTQDKLASDRKTSEKTLSVAEDKQTTERFSKAIEHLGSDKIDIRLGGIYALEQIVIDSPKYHWIIVEILTAFIRRESPIKEKETEADKEDKNLIVDFAVTIIGRRKAKQDPEGKWINLRRVNLREIEIEKKANFVEADLSKVNFSKAKMIEVNFSKANLSQANLSGASLIGADLSNAELRGAKLNQADLRKASLIRAILIEADLSTAKLSQANLSEASLIEADLSNADLHGAKLNQADLGGANLRGANLRGADLSGVNLTIANLSGADLSGTNLSRADLSGADLSGTNLSRADLSGACLSGTDLNGTESLTPEQIKRACYWDKAKYELGKLDRLKQDKASEPQESVNCSQWEIQNSLG
jgi:uncharacterized protein YjbI with pentapeptide repeats